MRLAAIVLILAGPLSAAGCHTAGTTPASDARPAHVAHPACVCGTHEAALHGCPAPACVSGAGDPANPKCRCAPLVPAAAPAQGSGR